MSKGVSRIILGILLAIGATVGLSPSLSAQQEPLPTKLGTQDAVPDDLRPDWSDNQGRPSKSIQVDAFTMNQQIQIDRVVSYEVDDEGKLTTSALFDGVVSKDAKVTVLACITTDKQEGVGVPAKIHFRKFNDLDISHSLTCNLVSEGDYGRARGFHNTHWFVSSTLVRFARAGFDPMTVSLDWLYNSLPASKPGLNDLLFDVSIDPRDAARAGHLTIHVFPYLDFDATSPILLVHGTAAQSDSWRVPADGHTSMNGSPASIHPVVSPIQGGGGFFDLHSPQAYLNPVVWFAGINLGTVFKADNVTVDKDRSGNESISTSSAQLYVQIDSILKALGARKFHLAAHSKGGSDARHLVMVAVGLEILLLPGDQRRDIQKEKYRLNSLFTIGTPQRGTPTANLAVNTVWYLPSRSSSGDGSLDGAINRDARVAAAMRLQGKGPSGFALSDQVVGSPALAQLNGPSVIGSVGAYTGGHFYNLVGDADLNGDQRVSFEEGRQLLPDTLQGWTGGLLNYSADLCDSMYQLTGKVGTIEAASAFSLIHGTYIKLTPHPYDPSQPSLLWPNDLVTPLWSGYLPGVAKPLVLAGDQGIPFIARTLAGPYNGVLSGGNHALLHRLETAQAILLKSRGITPFRSLNEIQSGGVAGCQFRFRRACGRVVHQPIPP